VKQAEKNLKALAQEDRF